MTFPVDSTALALFGFFLSSPHHTLSFGCGRPEIRLCLALGHYLGQMSLKSCQNYNAASTLDSLCRSESGYDTHFTHTFDRNNGQKWSSVVPLIARLISTLGYSWGIISSSVRHWLISVNDSSDIFNNIQIQEVEGNVGPLPSINDKCKEKPLVLS